MISIFKSIFINFHEETQNAVQWYWICETSCKEITWFATKFCIPLVLPRFAGKTKFISLKSNYFSQISQSTRLRLKIFIFLLWTPVLKYRFSLYIVNLKEVGHNEIVWSQEKRLSFLCSLLVALIYDKTSKMKDARSELERYLLVKECAVHENSSHM